MIYLLTEFIFLVPFYLFCKAKHKTYVISFFMPHNFDRSY